MSYRVAIYEHSEFGGHRRLVVATGKLGEGLAREMYGLSDLKPRQVVHLQRHEPDAHNPSCTWPTVESRSYGETVLVDRDPVDPAHDAR